MTSKHQQIAKPGISSGLTSNFHLWFVTSTSVFNQQRLWADGILMPHLHKALPVSGNYMTDLQLEKINKVRTVAQAQLSDIQKIAGINSLILSTCLVDTLAGFYCGYNGQKTGNKDRFLKFVDKYLVGHKAYLYDLRCNIVHSFSNTIANFMFIDDKNFTTVYGNVHQLLDWKIFNIDTFKNDLASAVTNYFNDLISINNNQLITDFNTRFDSLNILGDGVFPAMKNLKGDYVLNINEFDTLPGTDLKIGYYDPIKVKK